MIKNLHVYNLNKKLKYGLVCSSLIAGSLMLTACSHGSNALYSTTGNENLFEQTTTASQQNNVTEEERETYSISGNTPLTNISDNQLNGKYVNISLSAAELFNNYLTTNPVDYKYANLYEIDAALKEDANYKKPTVYSNKLNIITGDELYDVVVENNDAYLKETQMKVYHEFKKKELKAICDKIADICNNQLKESSDINEDELKCTLSNLKIFESGGSFCNGYVSYDYCFILSPNMADLLNMMDEENDMSDIVTHETIHLIQMDSPASYDVNENLKGAYGFVREYNNLNVNSLNNLWLAEASAEKCMCNFENQEAITYQNYINYMESFAMVNLVNDNYHNHDAEYLVYKDSLDDLYNFFGAKTEAEKREILNMMYTIQVMQQKPDDFYTSYNAYLGHDASDAEIAELNNELRSEVCESLNRLFYRNLTNKISQDKVELNDIFYLISVYEMDLNNHVAYSVSDCYYRNEDLMNDYVDIQDEFFRTVANSLNMDYEDFVDLYNNYSAKSNEGNNYNLTWLGQDKINYIDERIEDLSSSISVNVRLSNEQLKENTKTK